jgi:hypothetical protein
VEKKSLFVFISDSRKQPNYSEWHVLNLRN